MLFIKDILKIFNTPSKFLFLCIGFGLLMFVGARLNIWVSEYKLNESISRCDSEKIAYEEKRIHIENNKTNGTIYPWEMARIAGSDIIGFRCTHYSEITEESENLKLGKEYRFLLDYLALLCCALGILPSLWYFFLRRLSEVAAAIRSK